MIRLFFAIPVGLIVLWGAAESYTRNKYGEFSPQHSAVLQMLPISRP